MLCPMFNSSLSLEGGRVTASFPQNKLQKGLKFSVKIRALLKILTKF